MSINQDLLEQEIHSLGTEVFLEAQQSSISLFDPQFYTGKLMDWAMQDEEFKISLFRFVDVLPSLTTSAGVIRLAQEYFEPVSKRIPGILKWGFNVDPKSITAKLAAQVIRKQIRSVAENFIVGETPKSALKGLRKIRKNGMCFTVDLLGEATLSEQESLAYKERYLDLLSVLHAEVPQWSESRELIPGHLGEQTPINISVKLSALYSQSKAVDTEGSITTLSNRLTEILRKAKEVNAFVYLDMEDCGLTEIILEAFKRSLMLEEFRSWDQCGIVLQAYLRRTEQDLDELISWARTRGTRIAVRLVKGAYWDTETILAKQNGWPIPVWQEKSASDANYEKLSITLLQNKDIILPAFGSHNVRSLVHAIKAAEQLGVEKTEFELQALFGMAEPIKKAFVNRGFLIREYSPIGDLIPGMGYLVRRLLENTSNEGFLRQGFHENETAEALMVKPLVTRPDTGEEHLKTNPREKFVNIHLSDFTVPETRQQFAESIESAKKNLRSNPAVVKPVIAGKVLNPGNSLPSTSPEDPNFVLANVSLADKEMAEKAVQAVHDYFPTWRSTSVESRAEILFRAAELMTERRVELATTMILEAGKPWIEADADVAEAIDFLNYYAHEALRLAPPRRMGDRPGELNTYFYEPRGVTLVISPWNFPLAIPCGMFVAALVTGNTAILKPAEQTSLIAQQLYDLLIEAGLPAEAACFLPGIGEEIGAYLVDHEKISTTVFTGSKEVGLNIIRTSADTRPGFTHVKRVIAEMGGKNAIIIDENADLDEAVKGVVYSAFGFQGQKCSACSRVIVHDAVYEKFLERLCDATKSINVGAASDPGTFVAPVVDDEAARRIRDTIERSSKELKLAAVGAEPRGNVSGERLIRPHVFTDIPEGHFLLQTEVFGPVLAVLRADSFEQALEMACDSEYGLTGAIYSRSPKNIMLAVQDFRVGNLYINRSSTGALVMRQPFGGAKMSGVGSKAGGPDYLLQFLIPRAVSENTLRRGFAPAD